MAYQSPRTFMLTTTERLGEGNSQIPAFKVDGNRLHEYAPSVLRHHTVPATGAAAETHNYVTPTSARTAPQPMMLVGKTQTASSVQTSRVTERLPTTADSIALVDGMDTLIGHQVHAFDQDLWEKTMSLSFAWDFTYWYSFPGGSQAWQFTENPYTDRTPSNPFVLEMASREIPQTEQQSSLKHRDPALARSISSMQFGQRLKGASDTSNKGDFGITSSFDVARGIDVPIHHDNGVYGSIDQWFYGEHIPWNVAFPSSKFTSTVGFIFAGSGPKVTCLAYAQAWFLQPFKGIPNLPTKEFAIFLERETRDGVAGARRNYWLSKFEDTKYGLTVDTELAAGGHNRLEPEPNAFMKRNPKWLRLSEPPPSASGVKLSEQLSDTSGPEDSEYKALIKTLQSRVEPGEASRTVLPFMMTVVDLDFYHVGYLHPDSTSDPMLRILYNMCMGDLNSMLVQTGRRYLHSAVPYSSHQPFVNRLREGLWANPRSMDGDTLPQASFVDDRQTRRNSGLFAEFANAVLGLTDDAERTSKAASNTWRTLYDTHFTKDGLFYGNPYTLGRASNSQDLYGLLNGVFGNFTKRRLELVDHKGDDFDTVICQGPVCALSGFLVGSIRKGDTWLGIENKQDGTKEVRHHFALFLNLHDITNMDGVLVTTKIRDAYLLLDIPGSAMQLGFDLIKFVQQTP